MKEEKDGEKVNGREKKTGKEWRGGDWKDTKGDGGEEDDETTHKKKK